MLSQYAQQTMVDTMPIAACVFIGPDHIISAANEQMLATWNKTAGVIGQPLRSAVSQLDELGFYDLLNRVYQTGEHIRDPEGRAAQLIDGELQTVYLDHSFKPLRDKEGNIYGVVSTAVDISACIRAISELKETVQELAASNEELSALNEEYLALNEELEAGGEELRATNEELFDTREQLIQSTADLANSEERLLLAADAVNLGIYDIDLEHNQIVTSKRFDDIFGFDGPKELSAYQKALYPEDMPIRNAALALALANGQLFYEVRMIKSDGTIAWVRAEGKVMFNKAGKPKRLLGTLLDFTEERHDKEVQRKLKTLADNSADLMSLLDLDGKNSYINQAGKDLLGFEGDEEVLTTPIEELHTEEDFLQVQTDVLPSVMNEGHWAGVMRVRHLKTGEIFPVYNYTVRIDDASSGKPIGIGAIMRDLRPELASRKALADSEQMLRNVTSAAPTALWMSDQTGQITYVNQTWVDWTGRSEKESLGNGWLDVVVVDDRTRVLKTYMNALSNLQPFEVEYRVTNPEGETRWFSANGHPQFDSEHKFSGFVGACTDVSSQKELQQHKDDFISIASHELKTPITGLKAALQLLNRIKIQSENPIVPKLLLQAGKSVERVSALIDDLLNVSRLEQKEVHLQKTRFLISELCSSCANPIVLAGKHKVRIAGDLDVPVYADEHRIDQVLTNFLTNATKYAPNSEEVNITIAKQDGYVKISVTDNGPGIPKDRLKRLFERYYRVDDSIQHVSGLGLGLYICDDIIKRHEGQIGAESELGKGSRFWFTLPLS